VGSPGIVFCAISISLSAMTYWAFTFQVSGLRLSSRGRKLALNGVAGTAVPVIAFSMSRGSENPHHTLDRRVSDLESGFRTIRPGMMQPTQRVLSSATTRLPRQISPRAEDE
jgi:hypothetical protein